MEKDENGTNYIPADVPFWLFVEDDSPAKDGYFNPLYKMGPNNKPEQMITWASLHQGYGVWDGLHNQIDGKVPIQRYSEPVADVMPEVLLVNRWNYPLAWPEQPQEGVSREGSTHIEPNVDWGFDVFNSVTKEMYKLNAWKTDAPPKPVITAASAERVFIDLNGFPLEARISTDKNFSDAKWDYINVAKGGALLPEGASEGTTYYVQTRNTFGESEIATYKYRITQQ